MSAIGGLVAVRATGTGAREPDAHRVHRAWFGHPVAITGDAAPYEL
jgi:hypothetical protein